MEEVSLGIYIPSYKRAKTCITHKWLENYRYVVRLDVGGVAALSERQDDEAAARQMKAACEKSQAVCTSLKKEKMCIRDRLKGQVIKVSQNSTQYINPMDINLNYSEGDTPIALKRCV